MIKKYKTKCKYCGKTIERQIIRPIGSICFDCKMEHNRQRTRARYLKLKK